MKKVILVGLIMWSFNFYAKAQCYDCKTMAEAIKKPKKVRTIKMNAHRDGKLDTLLPIIGEFKNIEIMWLSDHDFHSVPSEIGNCKKLQKLSFAGCNLSTLPEEVYSLKYLRELVLLDNRFTEAEKEKIKKRFAKEQPYTRVVFDFN